MRGSPYRISIPPDAEPEPEPFQDRHTPHSPVSKPMSLATRLFWGGIAWIVLLGIILVASCSR